MPRPKRETRNGQLYCPGCQRWKHPSRFSPAEKCNGTVTRFRPKCRTCEQSERTDRKNEDRALALVKQRAQTRAQAAGVALEFFMDDLNWSALVPIVDLYLNDDRAVCINCGHRPINERDTQLEHRAAPRAARDFARHHARNIAVLCGSCNAGKQDKGYADWLDDQEEARLSVAAYYGHGPDVPVRAPDAARPEWTPHHDGTSSFVPMTTCSDADCDRPVHLKGLCRAHYERGRLGMTITGPIARGPVVVGDEVYVPCPDELIPLAAQVVELDAQAITRVMWVHFMDAVMAGRPPFPLAITEHRDAS